MKGLLLVLGLAHTTGCTIVLGATGGAVAAGHNADRDNALAHGEQAERPRSVGGAVVKGAVTGFVIDAILVGLAFEATSLGHNCFPYGCSGT